MKGCPLCGREVWVSEVIGSCGDCIRTRPDEVLPDVLRRHALYRSEHGLPSEVPHDAEGLLCRFCANACRIGEGERGFCGVRRNLEGKIVGGINEAAVSWYHDPLPTNCVADWVCPAGTDVGYPDWSYSKGPEKGYTNLAVFYRACTFHCLNCQNWHFRDTDLDAKGVTPGELASAVNKRDSCICYFGGDPTPFLPHSLRAARLAREDNKRILRICYETNGAMQRPFLKGMLKTALESGGIIKFDLKAYDENLHRAMTGVSNRQTLNNFAWLAMHTKERKDYPLLVASTLLIPGLIDEKEIRSLCHLIAGLNPDIPYALLAFHPDSRLHDLPTTSRELAEASLVAAIEAGLRKVRVGNIHLLS
jgi:pyruvate formate lyase activating enzyme